MAAVGNITATKLTSKGAALAINANSVYTRTVVATLASGATAGTADLTGFTIPKGTMVLGGAYKVSAAQGSATYQFGLTTDGTLGTKVANNAVDTWVAIPSPTPVVATADRTVQYINADANTVAGTLTLTLFCIDVENSLPTYTSYSA